MHIYLLIFCVCQALLHMVPTHAMFRTAGTASKTRTAARSTAARTAAPSLWARLKTRASNYFTLKSTYHTSAARAAQERPTGSQRGAELKFEFSKIFKLQNPFSWKAWNTSNFGTSSTDGSAQNKKEYESKQPNYTEEELVDALRVYAKNKGLRESAKSLFDVVIYIITQDSNNLEALEHAYQYTEMLFKRGDQGFTSMFGSGHFIKAIFDSKFERFISLAKKYGFEPSHEQQQSRQSQQQKDQSTESATRGFWSDMSMKYKVSKYKTNKEREQRIRGILTNFKWWNYKEKFTQEEIDEVYYIFESMFTGSSDAFLDIIPIFIRMADAGIGKDDIRYKTLYEKLKPLIKPIEKKVYSGEWPDTGFEIGPRVNLVVSILESFYKNDPKAVDYAYSLYTELPPRHQRQYFGRIIHSGGTKISEKFRNLYGQLEDKPDINVIEAIRRYDNGNKEGMAYADRMFEKLKASTRTEYNLKTDADNISIIAALVNNAHVRNVEQTAIWGYSVPKLYEDENIFVSLLLHEALEGFKRNNQDPRKSYRGWDKFYAQLSWVYDDHSDKSRSLENIFKKYGFYPAQEEQRSSDSSYSQENQQSGQQKGSYNRSYSPGKIRETDYKVFGLKAGAPFSEVHEKYLELVKEYHPDSVRNRLLQEGKTEEEAKQKAKEGEQKMKLINPAYDRIKAAQGTKNNGKKRPEDL